MMGVGGLCILLTLAVMVSGAGAQYSDDGDWELPKLECDPDLPERYELFSPLGCHAILTCDPEGGPLTQSCVEGYFNGSVCLDAHFVSCREGRRPPSLLRLVEQRVDLMWEILEATAQYKLVADPLPPSAPLVRPFNDVSVCLRVVNGRAPLKTACHHYLQCSNGRYNDSLPCERGPGLEFLVYDDEVKECVMPSTASREECRPRHLRTGRSAKHRHAIRPTKAAMNRACRKLAHRGRNLQFSDEVENSCETYIRCTNDGLGFLQECDPQRVFDQLFDECVRRVSTKRKMCKESSSRDRGPPGWPPCPDEYDLDYSIHGNQMRIAHPTNCSKFMICTLGTATPQSCSVAGTSFDQRNEVCRDSEDVPGCEP